MEHTAEILSVGTELLLGNIANTDAKDVSEALSALGINVYFHTVVGDNPERVKQAVAIAKTRADIILTTGGLGPTYDDLTKQTLCEAFGKKLEFHEDIAREIEEFFLKRTHGMPLTKNNYQQAYLPEGCTVFHNDWGTAPGCAFEAEGKTVLMLPGPPRECRAMLHACAVPYLKRLSDSEIHSHNLHIIGVGESAVEDRLRPMMLELTNPTLAPYAKEGEVMLRVTAKAGSAEEAEALMAPVIEEVKAAVGDALYGIDTGSLENTILDILREQGRTLAAAESCTGGLISKRITDIPGASRVFLGGAVTYSNGSKTALLGVPAELIREKGAVSAEVAEAMASGARRVTGADVAVAVTGLAGPDGDGTDVPVGTLFVAVSDENGTAVQKHVFEIDRERFRIFAASRALDMVRRRICGLSL
ncbi:MAG: competence/damage-inducible protein A [Oscillospiraceae bacterium]|nr:competence/damage-inducible protein A [Oscillospiraceae bacterium]